LLAVLLIVDLLFLLLTLGYQNDDLAAAGPPSPTKALNHANWRRQAVIRDNEVDRADIEAFLAHARSYKSVQLAFFEEMNSGLLNFL